VKVYLQKISVAEHMEINVNGITQQTDVIIAMITLIYKITAQMDVIKNL